jgi:hypothetical protein
LFGAAVTTSYTAAGIAGVAYNLAMTGNLIYLVLRIKFILIIFYFKFIKLGLKVGQNNTQL